MLRRYKKGIAILLLLTFGQEIFLPSTLWALTGGPSQPEVNSFEPVGTNQMVDLTTGDFNYNIPLMVVPGPNGGYPINLAYHAGVGMEQEASWVGLGWNINPGAITRNLRGIPDDFSGDEIVKKTNLKADVTAGLSLNMSQIIAPEKENEKVGYKASEAIVPNTTLGVYFNNYRGVGYSMNYSRAAKIDEEVKTGNKYNSFFKIGGVSFDSNTGLGMDLTFNLSKHKSQEEKKWRSAGYSMGVGLNTKQGLGALSFSRNKSKDGLQRSFSRGSSISFANQTYVPGTNNSMIGTNTQLGGIISGKDSHPVQKKAKMLRGELTTNKLDVNEIKYSTYGTVYLENETTSEGGKRYNTLMDINVTNDIPINKRSVYMGFPLMTSDLYSITGQGIGGTFRAHRNDIAATYESGNTSNTIIVSNSTEQSFSVKPSEKLSYIKILTGTGVDSKGGYHHSYSGKWSKDFSILEDGEVDNSLGLEFQKNNYGNPKDENFYFKVIGEKTANKKNEWAYMKYDAPVAFHIEMDLLGKSPKPITRGNVRGGGKLTARRDSQNQSNDGRVKRIQNIEFSKKEELINHEKYSSRGAHIFNLGDYPGVDAGMRIDYDEIDGTDENINHHIHKFSILRPDGSRYTYGLPAYNTHQEENVFANSPGPEMEGIGEYEDADLVGYDALDADITNDEGVDHYYSGTEIPSYTHANMITEITSADYVDIKGDGLTEDDFGFYAKFNYIEVSDYKWRDPFFDANYIKGHYSNELDDKATFSYGSKNLFYVHSIETKTHIAIFELGDRADGMGVNGDSSDGLGGRNQKDGDDLGKKQKYLKTIKLYSKNDLNYGTSNAVPLQTIHFEYAYELCQGIYNSDDVIDDSNHFDTSGGPQSGKLTLKKLWITYNGNSKGRLSPYEFSYNENPDYSRLEIDRWGNYQKAVGPNPYENTVNPYTRQDNRSVVDKNAAAWALSKVNLPSGGAIDINYESDDYGYVQNQRATQMVEVLGFTKTNQEIWVDNVESSLLKKKNLRLWFAADNLEGVALADRSKVIKDYIEGLDEIYFKVFENLKKPYDLSEKIAEDYVVGYAEIDKNSYGTDITGGFYGYVDLKPVKYKSVGLNSFNAHPFRKAGWQYLRYTRSDLFNDQGTYDDVADGVGSALLSIPLTLVSVVKEVLATLTLGQYNQFSILGYCKSISERKKSFVRLNSPNKQKLGGGHRVKSILLADNWVEGTRDFGTTYNYKNEFGVTSGVADYEPIVGGEENALKKPLRYNGNGQLINFQHQDIYIETPIAEAVFPGARVVYGRVEVKNLDNSHSDRSVDDSQGGITVNQFYTAKDFPVETKFTKLEQDGITTPTYIPFVGFKSVNNRGYSQGYAVVLNDMSGKPKSVATYPYRDGMVEGDPISEIKYRYKIDANGRLDNEVTVLDGHGQRRNAIIGVEQDFTIFEEENKGYTESLGFESGVNLKNEVSTSVPPGPPIPGVFLPYNKLTASHSESMYRGISTSKVIHKAGILEEVEVFSDGSTVVTKNILFDAETGEALLTTVNNEWDKPVYNYNYAAHWNYEEMGGAYQNYRAKILIRQGITNLYIASYIDDSAINLDGILDVGDEVNVKVDGVYRTFYVSWISSLGTHFNMEDEFGVLADIDATGSGIKGVVTRSHHRNLQSAKSGSVVALNDAFLNLDSELAPQFVAWNTYVTGANPQVGEDDPDGLIDYLDLNTNSTDSYNWDGRELFVPNYYNCFDGEYNTYRVLSNMGSYNADQIIFSSSNSKSNCRGILTFTDTDTPRDTDLIYGVELESGQLSFTEQLVEFKISSQTVLDGVVTNVVLEHIPTGQTFNASWVEGITNSNCWSLCLKADVLHADAIEYADDWSYPYSDVGDPEVVAGVNISDDALNKYRYGKKGIWRAKRTHLYQESRKQSNINTRVNTDGEYTEWEPYSWIPDHLNPKWDWVSEITKYSPYGYAIEEKSRLGYDPNKLDTPEVETEIYSSQMYGYGNSVVVATSALASYFEMGYTGFEQKNASSYPIDNGHINLGNPDYTISDQRSHTGTNALILNSGESIVINVLKYSDEGTLLHGIPGKDYVISLWVNVESFNAEGRLSVLDKTVNTNTSRELIDGWKKLELKFTMPNTAYVNISYNSIGETYIDDLRFGPYDGGMVTYVYDRNNLWLTAELDGLNYATFYNYDSEGNLVQVKKETEKGIVTVQTSRSNTLQR